MCRTFPRLNTSLHDCLKELIAAELKRDPGEPIPDVFIFGNVAHALWDWPLSLKDFVSAVLCLADEGLIDYDPENGVMTWRPRSSCGVST
jgi:hypothetical protein